MSSLLDRMKYLLVGTSTSPVLPLPTPFQIFSGRGKTTVDRSVSPCTEYKKCCCSRGDEKVHNVPGKAGTVKNEQILIIKELFKNAEFTCHANNSEGKVERTVTVTITGKKIYTRSGRPARTRTYLLSGPGSAPVLRGALSGRTNIAVRWEPPHIINRPITSYTVYYTNNGNQPIKNWQRMEVKGRWNTGLRCQSTAHDGTTAILETLLGFRFIFALPSFCAIPA